MYCTGKQHDKSAQNGAQLTRWCSVVSSVPRWVQSYEGLESYMQTTKLNSTNKRQTEEMRLLKAVQKKMR